MNHRLLPIALRIIHRLLKPVLYTALGGLIAVVIIAVIYLNNKPDLSVWHTEFLDKEFSSSSEVARFDSYLKLEDELFEQLELQVYNKVPASEKTSVNRFNAGSKTDPSTRSPNWNRTFELEMDTPSAGVLLLHGLSDSPYSMRTLGRQMHADGAYVIGLRIPGHGTAPSGLRRTTFQDMSAAVDLAMRHLSSKVGDVPLILVGYSNGGALAVHYASNSISDTSLPAPSGLVLLSPEIGIAPVAALAGVQAWLGEKLRLNKLAWNSVQVEFDPYKYNSFALNAGILAYNATQLIQAQLKELAANEQIDKMPPILAFQSVADATVRAPALVNQLFARLQNGGHELVLFDVNRVYEAQGLFTKPFEISNMISGEPRKYKVSIITNKSPDSLSTVLRERPADSQQVRETDLEMKWPIDVYSLSHIALPFPPDDPLYGSGGPGSAKEKELRIGGLAIHGENRTLSIPISAITRQHWNPFFDVISEKSQAFVRQFPAQ